MLRAVLYIFFIFINKVSKLLKVGKTPACFKLEAISINRYYSEYIRYISYLYDLYYLYAFFPWTQCA